MKGPVVLEGLNGLNVLFQYPGAALSFSGRVCLEGHVGAVVGGDAPEVRLLRGEMVKDNALGLARSALGLGLMAQGDLH